MYQLIYFSSASHPHSKDELLDILTAARKNNAAHGITGMLLYKDGSFIQVLEGQQTSVERCFELIDKDPRHKNISVIDKGEIDERQFGDWSMGFNDLTDSELKSLPGFTEYLNSSMELEDFVFDVSATKDLLQLFACGGLKPA